MAELAFLNLAGVGMTVSFAACIEVAALRHTQGADVRWSMGLLFTDVVPRPLLQGGPATLWQCFTPDEDNGRRPDNADIMLLFGGGDGVISCVHYDVLVPPELDAALSSSDREQFSQVGVSSSLRKGLA
jgi:hypothetical protein